MARNGVLVVGSANMDMVVRTDRFPHPGETLFGSHFAMYPGGKGANQAVACAKLGRKVYFVGKMGSDVFCERLTSNMRKDGVKVNYMFNDPSEPTGIAMITVDGKGQNEILVVSGSNMKLRPEDVEEREELFKNVRVLLLQLEIPLETVIRAAEIAKANGVLVILNPAPARKLPKRLLSMVDYLTPNESEIQMLSGITVKNPATAERAARKLLDDGVKNVLVTLGPRGCLLVSREATRLFPAHEVKAVDTTAAGDAFNGALAFVLSSGRGLPEAIPFANTVAAFSVTRPGAQSSMPTMEELQAFID